MVVKLLEHEGDNELKESGFGSISLNLFVNPDLFSLEFLEFFFNCFGHLSFRSSLFIPVFSLGELFNLAVHLFGHLTLDETGIGSELEERSGRESESLYH